jgi:hypothetical protein
MRQSLRFSGLAVFLLACLTLFVAGPSGAAKADDNGKPLKSSVTITGIVEDDYVDGLLVTTEDGTSYMVLTPEEVSLEQEEAFHKKFKGQSVTLTGNVFRDEDGSLSLFVTSLPAQ